MNGFNFDFYQNIDNHKASRVRAFKRFDAHYTPARYAKHTLPILGYETQSFDLILSSHLLFVYDDRFSYEFHLEAIKEMLRVAKKVQIFPLINFQNPHVDEDKNFSPYVYKILEDLKEYTPKIEEVNFEFQPRGNYQLILESTWYNQHMTLKYENVYADKFSLKIIKESDEAQITKLYLNKIYNRLENLNLQGFDIYVEKESFSGFFSTKTQILTVEFKKSRIKRLNACFFIQNNGNSFSFRLYKGMDRAYFKDLLEKPQAQRLEFIKTRLRSFEEREEFTSFDTLMDMMFDQAVSELSLS